MIDVLVFTAVHRLEPETVQALWALQWDGPLSYLLQRDNPYGHGSRAAAVKNHLHQYRRGREAFLAGRYDALFVVESDIIPPANALERLAALDVDMAYGCYLLRSGPPVVNVRERYGPYAKNMGESLTIRGKWRQALAKGAVPCAGGGLGCVLIRRRVLEEIDFRLADQAFADSAFDSDCYQAGFSMVADTAVQCGHKTPEGAVLWPSGANARERLAAHG